MLKWTGLTVTNLQLNRVRMKDEHSEDSTVKTPSSSHGSPAPECVWVQVGVQHTSLSSLHPSSFSWGKYCLKISEGTAHLRSDPRKCQEENGEVGQENEAIQTAISSKLRLWEMVSDPTGKPGKWWKTPPFIWRPGGWSLIYQLVPMGRMGVTSQLIPL